ncbi:uncharacterized protein LOC123531979 [Mercenaria mercenaria]|uniref:uncharacterized protein LOC123531979 n=1 Tax=Mercenaria mercenaria TaxID=6596 RepID=UPI00234E895F|nr:uncharacterized protein LOC123531979 [Mercenaria mercenaria]
MMSKGNKGSQIVTLKVGDGSECTINLHGATVTSWKNKGEDIFFCSEKAVFDGKSPIRGGIPIVFPHMGLWNLGPKHGFARIKQWKVAETVTQSVDDPSCRVFILEDDEETRNMWNARFRLEYTVNLAEDSLRVSLKVFNKGTQNSFSCDEAFSFMTLMHTYFRVDDVTKAGVKGLKGLKYKDVINGGEHLEERETVTINNEEFDGIYKKCPCPVELVPEMDKTTSRRRLVTMNLNDTIVWNPWAERAKATPDLGDKEYHNMLCVMSGAVSEPNILGAGQYMTFTLTIVVD